jgi:hypothetical protein
MLGIAFSGSAYDRLGLWSPELTAVRSNSRGPIALTTAPSLPCVRFPMKTVAEVIGVSCSNLTECLQEADR